MTVLSDKLVRDTLEFLLDLHNPEGYGFSVTEEVHEESMMLVRRFKLELEKETKN
jgi:hypothetical protein